MFEQVVVGIDGSDTGRDAVALAQELAGAGSQLVLANVYIAGTWPARGNAGIFTSGQREQAHEVLKQAAAEAGGNVKVAAVASHYVGRGLHELAEETDADLIVVGSSKQGLMGRVWHGNDMRGALNGAPSAVAIAPMGYAQHPHALSEVGVGYDGSPESRRALDAARQLATQHGAKLSAFEAVPVNAAYAEGRHPQQETIDQLVADALERLRALDGVEPHASYGEPGEELALYGAGVDLLVVGSRSYGPLGRMLHGSTSHHLAGAARCPLLVVPRPETAPPRETTAAEAETTAGAAS
jgi:nucleotide-binding universal stress UspA family protein